MSNYYDGISRECFEFAGLVYQMGDGPVCSVRFTSGNKLFAYVINFPPDGTTGLLGLPGNKWAQLWGTTGILSITGIGWNDLSGFGFDRWIRGKCRMVPYDHASICISRI
jgi:hypothetical protein